jgi:hypothetical protein
MGFVIKRHDGLVMFDGNSDKIADKYYSFEGDRRRTISLSFRVNLPQGSYFVGVFSLSPMRGFHLCEDEAAEFHVTGPKTLGCAFVDTRWE